MAGLNSEIAEVITIPRFIRGLLALLLITAYPEVGHTQTLRINAFGGYTFQERFNVNNGFYAYRTATLNGANHFGGGLELVLRPEYAVEIFYQAQPTQGYLESSINRLGPYSVTTNYIMVGATRSLAFNDVVEGYTGVAVGAGFLTGQVDAARAAWGVKGGVLLHATPTIGIRLGAQLFSPIEGIGGGLTVGSGGSGVNVGTYSSIFQFGFTGGLCFTLPQKSTAN